MIRYFRTSAIIHFSLLLVFLFIPRFWHSNNLLLIEGFDFVGGGGGGGGDGGGPKASQMGQVVPQPVKIPIPAKPAPVQKATKSEEAWAVRQKNTPAPKKEEKPTAELPTSDKAQSEQTNVIRRGVSADTKAGEGYDFGGTGQGKGPGVGIGFGPGEGGGFGYGSYLTIMRQRIWGEWTQSAVLGSNYACVVGLTVASNGDISKISLEKSSGNAFYDNLALRAVRNSSPLPPLPSGLNKDEQRFRIQFKLVD